MAQKLLTQLLTGQKLKSGTSFTVVRVANKTGHAKVKKWLRDNCKLSYGISRTASRHKQDKSGQWELETYFYVAFSDKQDLLMARFVLDDITPRPMWESSITFQIHIREYVDVDE